MSDRARLHILGSGSSGNSAIVAVGRRLIQIDLGLGPRTSARRAEALGLDLDRVEAAIITHGDRDHITHTWGRTLASRPIPVYVAEAHVGAVLSAGVPPTCIRRLCQTAEIADWLVVRTAIAPHDTEGSTSLRLEFPRHALAVAWLTDLGRVVPGVEALIEGCDAIAIESNYDRGMQNASPRPAFLKARIMGGHGHLSNEEALDAVARLEKASPLLAVVLLHLSRECNCPELVQSLWDRELPEIAERLHIAHASMPLGPIDLSAPVPAL